MKKITSPARERRLLSKGFTIVELLIVIAIIGLLTGIVMTSLTPAKSKARDAKRISDLGNVQAALELYFDRCKQYPISTGGWLDLNTANGCPANVKLGTYITTLPTNTTGAVPYDYATNLDWDSNGTSIDYALGVSLENYNEVLKDDLDTIPDGASDVYGCGAPNNGEGTNERKYCLGPK